MSFAIYVYKCRKCGKVYESDIESDWGNEGLTAHNILTNSIYRIDINRSAPMLEVHRCSKHDMGIADLVGVNEQTDE
jgi:hypothetical protein